MYNKLFTKILSSSVWMEDMPTRIVWLTMLASMDEDGFVAFASPSNIAHIARVSIEDARHAIERLEAPDEDSSDPDNDGRRIERVQGGWIVLNGPKYRDLATRAAIKEQGRLRVQRYREKKRRCNADVTPSEAYTQSEAEPEIQKSKESSVLEDSNPMDIKPASFSSKTPPTAGGGNPPCSAPPPLEKLMAHAEQWCPRVCDSGRVEELHALWLTNGFTDPRDGSPIHNWKAFLNKLENAQNKAINQ